jgi:predicted glycosyltransferase
LVEKVKRQTNDEMVTLATTYFDAVLVHGDPALISFDATFPLAAELKGRLHYTGYVVDRAAVAAVAALPASGEVVVSAGGGAVSEDLLRCAIETRPLTAIGRGACLSVIICPNRVSPSYGPMLPQALSSSVPGPIFSRSLPRRGCPSRRADITR